MTTDTKVVELTGDEITIKERTPLQVVLMRLRKHKLAMISLFLMFAIFLVTLFAAQLANFEVQEIKVGDYLLSPGAVDEKTGRVHLLGTDNIGRDYFSRLLYAGRISLTVAFISVVISELPGMTIGAISGYYGGAVDNVLMRFVEFMLTVPSLPLLLIISSMLLANEDLIPIPPVILNAIGKVMLLNARDARSAVLIILVLAGFGWLGSAQLMRGMVLQIKQQTFVEAARSLGASNFWIIFRHMIPNAMAPIIVSASLGLAGYVVAEASLSFLGFGIQEPIPTWGNMLAATQTYMLDKPYLPLIPGTPIFVCSLAFNYIGDGLRDALDPRLKM